MTTAQKVLDIARGEIGYSRWNDPLNGTKYGRWYEVNVDRNVNNYDFGGNGVPYCGMFVSWVFNQAGASCAGVPGAYTPAMLSAGRSAGKSVAISNAQPGDVVYFDWGGDGETDHVGIVESNNGSSLVCIEGNTTGTNGQSGGVNRRTRNYGSVSGVVRPNWGTNSGNTQSAPVTNSGVSGSLEVDGQWGPATTRVVQKALGTPIDGYVDGQDSSFDRTNRGGLLTSSWRKGSGGSPMVRALQKKVGSDADGLFGPNTCKALQRYLGTEADGYVDKNSPMVKELQRRLNAGKF